MHSNLIHMSNISKAFGASKALDCVSLELFPGSVHALMGENGAGKSTLMKILAGVHQPDSGKIYKNGHEIVFQNPRQALDFGISTVFQELSLLSNLTVAENMFLGHEPVTASGRVDYSTMNAQTAKALADIGVEIDPAALVSQLSISQRQFVEIAHGVKADAQIFILDEPTAALNAADVGLLNRQIRKLRDEGKAIVYISHRMDEIFEVCDTVTVLKDGKLVGTYPLSEMNPQSLVAKMVGRELQDLFPPRCVHAGEVLLNVENFKVSATSKPFSLQVKRGEIIALAGLEGQGQQKFMRSLIGQYQSFSGAVTIKSLPLALPVASAPGVRTLQRLGVGFVPEDRKEEGLFLGLPIAHNIDIGLHVRKGAATVAQNTKTLVDNIMKSMSVKAAGPKIPVGSLSGGNQQKVLLGRYLAAEMDILLIEEPTRGVDVGAKLEIYTLLREFTNKGGAVLVVSRETIELIGLCDRIYVMHGDTLVSEMAAVDATEHKILAAALAA